MSFLTNSDYPGSHYGDNDLSFFIREYKKLIKQYEELNEKYQELITLKDDLNAAIASIDPKIQTAINAALADVDNKFAQLQQQMTQTTNQLTAMVDAEIAKIPGMVSDQTAPIAADVDALKQSFISLSAEMTNFQTSINATVTEIKTTVDGLEDSLKASLTEYINEEIAKWQAVLPQVLNPVTDEYTGVQDAFDSVYNDYGNRLDNLDQSLTDQIADEVATLEAKIKTGDDSSNQRLISATTLRNPVTGLVSGVVELLQWICEQLKDAYTASELETLGITVAQIDGTEMSAFTYDWTHWLTVYDIALTAAQFDAGNITVEEMVDANVTALQFQTGRKWFDKILSERSA